MFLYYADIIVINAGDLPKHEKVSQLHKHFFEADELDNLLLQINGNLFV